MRLPFLAQISLAGSSFLITLVVLEIALSRFFPQPTLAGLKANSFGCYLTSDYLPFTLKPDCSARQQSAEFSTSVTVNSLGFRDREFTLTKPTNTYRVLVVGDSFTFGYGVNSEQIFTEKLETKLNRVYHQTVEVINAGFASGFSPDSYYLFLSRQLPQLQPDLVIFPIFVLNDITDMRDYTSWITTDDQGLPVAIQDTARYVDHGFLVNRDQPWYYRAGWLSDRHLFILVAKSLSSLYSRLLSRIQPPAPSAPKTALDYYLCLFTNQCFPEMEQLFKRTFSLIQASRDLAVSHSSQFILLILPADVQVDATAWEKYQAGRFGLSDPPYPQARFLEFCQANRLQCLDVLPAFLQHQSQPLFFKLDGHFTALGHELTAEQLFQFITHQ